MADKGSSSPRHRPDPSGSVSVLSGSGTFHTSRHCTVLKVTNTPCLVLNTSEQISMAQNDTAIISNQPNGNNTSLVPDQPSNSGVVNFPTTPHQSNIMVQGSQNYEPEGSVSSSYYGNHGTFQRANPTPSIGGNVPDEQSSSISDTIIQQEEEMNRQIHTKIGKICAATSDNV